MSTSKERLAHHSRAATGVETAPYGTDLYRVPLSCTVNISLLSCHFDPNPPGAIWQRPDYVLSSKTKGLLAVLFYQRRVARQPRDSAVGHRTASSRELLSVRRPSPETCICRPDGPAPDAPTQPRQ